MPASISSNKSNRILRVLAIAACLSFPASLSWGGEVNAAPLGVATQSTTANDGVASRAIDGNTSGNWGDGSISHTDPFDPTPWWQVDLGRVLPLNRIVLWNRTDCCAWRLSNFRVSILDDLGSEVQGEDFFTDQSYPATPDFEVLLPPGTEGQVVRVDALGLNSQGDMYISLAEVQVFVDSQAFPLTIIRQPRGGHIQEGATFVFSVDLLDPAGVTFQWLLDGREITGAQGSSYKICSAGAADAGTYTVVAKRGAEEITSDPADLEVVTGNLAPSGVAAQSSTGFGGDASRAIDGNVDGIYGDNSVSHTAGGDAAPWWELTLLGPSAIEKIVLWNRTDDCCMTRLSNFRVSVLNSAREPVQSEDFFTDGLGYPDTTAGGFEILMPPDTAGRFVRVEILGPNAFWGSELWLSLAEVEVIGVGPVAPENPNIALGETAIQSSTQEPYRAGLAVNGFLYDFTHTAAGETPATWAVDLCGMQEIEEIALHNRRDCCGSRLRDITVSILDSTGSMTLFESELLNPENVLGVYPDGPELLTLNLIELTGGPLEGGIVQVTRTPDEDLSGTGGLGDIYEATVLSLAEVEVFKPVVCPPEGDTHCKGLTVQGPPGGGPGDYTITASAADDSGDPILYTFEARHPVFYPVTAGPQLLEEATMRLGIGTWTLSVTVDDDRHCADEAADRTCSQELTVAGDPENLAPGGTASQSSTRIDGDAYRAIDGITDGNFFAGSVTHALEEDPAPWWQVDLGAEHALDRVVLWNRTDCCAERLTDFRVSVLDSLGAEVHGEDFFTDGASYPDTTAAGFEIPLPAGTKGQVVRIDLLGPSVTWSPRLILSLAEVQVFRGQGTGKTLFHRGDADGDGEMSITDPIVVLNFLFQGGSVPDCLEAANCDDSSDLDITDPVYILNWLFLGGKAPPSPGPVGSPCGEDPPGSPSDLGCASYPKC